MKLLQGGAYDEKMQNTIKSVEHTSKLVCFGCGLLFVGLILMSTVIFANANDGKHLLDGGAGNIILATAIYWTVRVILVPSTSF